MQKTEMLYQEDNSSWKRSLLYVRIQAVTYRLNY